MHALFTFYKFEWQYEHISTVYSQFKVHRNHGKVMFKPQNDLLLHLPLQSPS